MVTFIVYMWSWLPSPLNIIFSAMLVFLVLFALISLVAFFIDLLPFV